MVEGLFVLFMVRLDVSRVCDPRVFCVDIRKPGSFPELQASSSDLASFLPACAVFISKIRLDSRAQSMDLWYMCLNPCVVIFTCCCHCPSCYPRSSPYLFFRLLRWFTALVGHITLPILWFPLAPRSLLFLCCYMRVFPVFFCLICICLYLCK